MNKHVVLLVFLFVAGPLSLRSQTLMPGGRDAFGGWLRVSGSGHPHAQNATCSQNGTGQSCSVIDASVYWVDERIALLNCANPLLNYAFADDYDQGASHITARDLITNTVAMASDTSNQRVAPSACTFSPAKVFTETTAGGSGLGPKFFTPLNHYFFANSMVDLCGTSSVNNGRCSPKYGSNTCVARGAELNQYLSWNFNVMGPLGMDPTREGGCATGMHRPLFFGEIHVTNYAMSNLSNYASQATINVTVGTNGNWLHAGGGGVCTTYRSMPDVFAPYFIAQTTGWLTRMDSKNWALYPGFVGLLTDDTGGNEIFGNGPHFHGVLLSSKYQDCDPAMLVLMASPMITGNNRQYTYNNVIVIYPDPFVYSKVPMTTPPPNCNQTIDPCSLGTLVAKNYGTKDQVNSAWGTNYTTLGTSGTCIGWVPPYPCEGGNLPTETVGTGDGLTTTFRFTLANHSNISPFSIMFYVSGVPVAFDCPPYGFTKCSPKAGTGTIIGVTVSSGTVNYSTGISSITFTSAPALNAPITAKYCQNCWMYGTGLMDEDGRSRSLGTTAISLLSTPEWQPDHAYSVTDEVHDAPSGTWQFAMTSGRSGRSRPGFPVDVASNTQGVKTRDNGVLWESIGKPVSGVEVGSDHQVADMQSNLAGFLENSTLPQLVLKYYQSMGDVWKNAFPDTLYGGTDETFYDAVARPQLLDVANNKTDWIFAVPWDTSHDPNADAKVLFITRHYTHPIIDGIQFPTSRQHQPSAGSCCDTKPVYPTLAEMGHGWFLLEKFLVESTGVGGVHPFGGATHGGSHSYNGCNTCGLKDNLDNAMDGVENKTGAHKCAPPNATLDCEPEVPGGAWVDQDAIGNDMNGLIKQGNAYWFLGTPAVSSSGSQGIVLH